MNCNGTLGYLKICCGATIKHVQRRYCLRYFSKGIQTRDVRQSFLHYYIDEHGHNFTKSSPVVPFCDPTVPFVNAGMNQFKCIFLGTQSPRHDKVANSQKCIRVGGKHNDLEDVGSDGYHHTFFEMLGNWTFNKCDKSDVCSMAWNLLTEVYRLDRKRLYVTYFGGDADLGLQEDVECRDIWRSLRIPSSRIIPFGRKDNFWEMGLTGPCGPCTEIHYDHLGVFDRPELVNRNLHDLVELWNLVFIQYNMNPDGTITKLPCQHVDTGMGLERLTAVLQNTTSNYNIDAFQKLFTAIHKACPEITKYSGRFGESDWNYLDRDYRILADHSRLITASLSDGMIPEQNQKLRRIIRRSFAICDNTFNKGTNLINDVVANVVETLGQAYPEMEKNFNNTIQILRYEADVYKSLRNNATKEWKKLTMENPQLEHLDVIEMPGLIAAYKDIKSAKMDEITPEYGYKLYDTFGLDNNTISALCQALNINCNVDKLIQQLDIMKLRSKETNIHRGVSYNMKEILKHPKTDDSSKYDYSYENQRYHFCKLPVKVLMILDDQRNTITSMNDLEEYEVILDKSNLYSESGGQMSDSGVIEFDSGTFSIYSLKNYNGYIIHKGLFKSKNKHTRASIETLSGLLSINEDIRFKHMCNHTCVHLINAAFKQLKGVTCQKSSKVTHDYCNLDISCFCDKVKLSDVAHIENRVNDIINRAVPVTVTNIDSQDMLSLDNITTVPGEVYPDTGIRLVDIKHDNFHSSEPCCGTHVLNTKDIGDMRVVGFRSLGRSTSALHAVTGTRAQLAIRNGAELIKDIQDLQKNVQDNIDKPEVLELAVTALSKRLNYDLDNSTVLPILVKDEAKTILDSISKQIKNDSKERLKEFIEMEMRNALSTCTMRTPRNNLYLIHYLRCSMMLENVSLQRATNLCEGVPVIVMSYSDSIVKARCCIPENMRSEQFTAEKWLQTVCTVFRSTISSSFREDELVSQMKPKKINIPDWGSLLKESIETAKLYAETNL